MGRKIGTLGLVNYRRHPSDNNYIVFGFDKKEEALIFEEELTKSKTWFEKDTEETKFGLMYLFAVAESSMDEALAANGIAHLKNKKRTFGSNNILKYFIFIFVSLLIILAIIGYVKNPQNLSRDHLIESNDSTTFVTE